MRELRKGDFEFGYFLDLEQMSGNFISSPTPLQISGACLSFPQMKPEGRREKTKDSTSISPLCSLRSSQVEAIRFLSTYKKWDKLQGVRKEPEGYFLQSRQAGTVFCKL